MRKVKIPINAAMTIFPEIYDLGNMPRKKKKQMKKDFAKVFQEKFTIWFNENLI